MISLLMELTKFRLSAAVTLSAVFGFILAKGGDMILLGYSTLAVFILALGVSALNQYQEYRSDSQMIRTMHRPIPSGRISPQSVLYLSMGLITMALLLIFYELGYLGLLLFLFVPLWYNGVYTYLKRYSAFAVVPGGLLGIIPPAIGWLAAGKSLSDPKFFALGLLFFVWQVPHFWLMSAKYADDYRAAGFPTSVETFGIEGFRRVLFVWWTLMVFCSLFLIMMFGVQNLVLIVLFITLALAVVVIGTRILLDNLTPIHAGELFRVINLFLLLTLILLSVASI